MLNEDYSLLKDHEIQSPYISSRDVSLKDDGYIYFNAEKPVRGRFELSFVEIGTAVLAGGAIGSVQGLLEGRGAAAGHPPKLRRVMIFNHIVKKSTLGNSLGVVATLYAASGIAVSELRGTDDPVNTVIAAGVTGLLYRTSGGLLQMLYGGITGLTIGSFMAMWQGRQSLSQYFKSSFGSAKFS